MSRTEMTTLDHLGLGRTTVRWNNDSGMFFLEQEQEEFVGDTTEFITKIHKIELTPKETADLTTFMVKHLFEYID